MFPQSKVFVALQTTSVTNAGTATSQNIDCAGFDFLSLDLVSTTSDNVTNKPTVLKLQEADTTDATNFADITGFRGGTDFTIPNWGTNTSTILPQKFNVDLRHRKRYIRLLVSPVTTQSFTAVANLHRGGVSPVSAGDVGVSVVVSG
jgi:hypothetical protein